jgi:hypothetical protein
MLLILDVFSLSFTAYRVQIPNSLMNSTYIKNFRSINFSTSGMKSTTSFCLLTGPVLWTNKSLFYSPNFTTGVSTWSLPNSKFKLITTHMAPQIFLNFTLFNQNILNYLRLDRFSDLDFRIVFLVRVSYGEDCYFKMLGTQIGFDYKDNTDFSLLHKALLERLSVSENSYNYLDEEINCLSIHIYKVSYSEHVEKKSKTLFSLSDLGSNKDLVEYKGLNKYNSIIPYNTNTSSYGSLLYPRTNNTLDQDITVNGKDFMQLINNNSYNKPKVVIDNNSKILLSNNGQYVIHTKSDQLDNKIHNNITVYTTSGFELINIKDNFRIGRSEIFTRTIGNLSNIIDNNKVVSTNLKVKLSNIKPFKSSKNISHVNKFVGTLDTETYQTETGSKVYVLGYYTTKHGCYSLYIDSDLNSEKLILECFKSLLVDKYHNYVFYVHNLGNYDIVFILKVLSESNIYNLSIIGKDTKILSLTIKTKKNEKTSKVYSIKLVDSFNILNKSLKDLALTYKTQIVKGTFPYRFMNSNTIFYDGIKPSIEYFEDINLDVYNSIPKNWNAKKETLIYLESDLVSLFQVLDKFSTHIFRVYNVQVVESLTISGIALKIFLNKYYNNNIPLIVNRSVYRDIKQSYYGGVTEVYKPYGENLFYYDVNSLYPHAALNDMPGNNCVLETNINKNLKYLPTLFGFFYCSIKTSDLYLGLLPYRSVEHQGLIMPNGVWEGWYLSEELKFALECGYDIDVIKGYHFNKEVDVFKSYVEHFYSVKAGSTDTTRRAVSKSLLNNLLGRFGLSIERSATDLITEEKFNKLIQTQEITNAVKLGNYYFVTYNTYVSQNICDSVGVNFKKAVENNLKDNVGNKTMRDVSVAIPSAINSYARIYMAKIKLDIIKNRGVLYYSDTDSIITNNPLPTELIGPELGKFKLEHIIKRGYFISGKTYCLITDNGRIIKAKGVTKNKLSEHNFVNLFEGKTVLTSRNQSFKDYKEGYVDINISKEIKLDGNAYNKRSKIMYNDKWVDTKPLLINSQVNKDSKILLNEIRPPNKNDKDFINNIVSSSLDTMTISKPQKEEKFNLKDLFYWLLTILILVVSVIAWATMIEEYNDIEESESPTLNIPPQNSGYGDPKQTIETSKQMLRKRNETVWDDNENSGEVE